MVHGTGRGSIALAATLALLDHTEFHGTLGMSKHGNLCAGAPARGPSTGRATT
jgi:hypothetical protein